MSTNRIEVPKGLAENAKWRMRALEDGTRVSGAAKELRRACADDILFWVNTFCFTYDPRKEDSVIPFITYPYQDNAILKIVEGIERGHDVAIKKSRDMGASWMNILVPMWMWQFRPMKKFLFVSRNENYVDGDSDSLLWKVDFIYEHQPSWLRPRDVSKTSMHRKNDDNGSSIDGESTTGEVARGGRRTAILLDEFAAFDVKCGYNALASTRDATRCRIFNSTPKGVANAFYDVVHKSSAEIVSMHWSEHPEKSVGLYDSIRDEATGEMKVRQLDGFHGEVEVRVKGSGKSNVVVYPDDYPFVLDGRIRSPWYDLQCARAVSNVEIAQELDIDFQGSDFNFFDPIAIERYKDSYCRDPEMTCDVKLDRAALRVIDFERTSKGRMKFFEMPKRDGRWDTERRFVMGVDISAGTGASNSTIAVYDVESTEKVAEYANPNILPDDFARLAVAIARFFNFALIVPDRSGPTGEVFYARVKSDGDDLRVYRTRDANKIGNPISDKEGVFLGSRLKTKVLHQYRDAIGTCAIINRSRAAMDETLRFILRMDGTIEHSAATNSTDPNGARSNHGDMVIADALAFMAMEDAKKDVRAAESIDAPHGTLAWRMEVRRREEESDKEDLLTEGWEV